MKQSTLAIIKPDAFEGGFVGQIFDRLMEAGLEVEFAEVQRWEYYDAYLFYREHCEKSFFKDLVQFMSSGPIMVLCLRGDNAVAHLRTLIGPTVGAPKGTIRGDFGDPNVTYRNAIHASDSLNSADREIDFVSYFMHRQDSGATHEMA